MKISNKIFHLVFFLCLENQRLSVSIPIFNDLCLKVRNKLRVESFEILGGLKTFHQHNSEATYLLPPFLFLITNCSIKALIVK